MRIAYRGKNGPAIRSRLSRRPPFFKTSGDILRSLYTLPVAKDGERNWASTRATLSQGNFPLCTPFKGGKTTFFPIPFPLFLVQVSLDLSFFCMTRGEKWWA
jgi:hypothetical protein